jgi:1-acyl-sn-glycerol-3-phosphate acyltransferase
MTGTYRILKWAIGAYLRFFSLECQVGGYYPLPAGPKIIVANHPNATDSFFLPFILPEPLHFLMQKNLFANPVIGWMLRKAGQVEVNRTDGRAAFKQARRLLRTGKTIFIYPEGRLNASYERIKFKNGAVRMALETGAPIIPLGIFVPSENLKVLRLCRDGRSKLGYWQVSGQCYLKFGRPWRPGDEKPIPTTKKIDALSEALSNSIYQLVAEITSEEELCASHISLRPIPQL